MGGIKIYTIETKKMIKKGLSGWTVNQERAKTYFSSIKKDNKEYKVKITNEKLIEELFEFTSIPKEKKNFRYRRLWNTYFH